MDKATANNLSVQSFSMIKNTEHGNFVIGRVQTTARNGLSVSDSLCTVALSPTDTPSPIFSEAKNRLHTGYLKRIIHLQTVLQN